MSGNSFTIQSKILQLQIKYLNQKGPPLGLFASNNPNISIFCQIQQSQKSTKEIALKVELNVNSYIRAFYFCLLHLLYQHQSNQTIKKIQSKFKQFAYSDQVRLDIFNRSQIEPKYLEFYQNNILKKILVEFLQVLSYSRGSRKLVKMIRKYPIMDFVFILLIRSFMKVNEGNHNYLFLNYGIKPQKLMNFFVNLFKIPIKKISNHQYHFLFSKLNILEYHHSLLILTNSLKVQNSYNFKNIPLQSIEQECPHIVYSDTLNQNNLTQIYHQFNPFKQEPKVCQYDQEMSERQTINIRQQQKSKNDDAETFDKSFHMQLQQSCQSNQNIDMAEQNQTILPFWKRIQSNPFIKQKASQNKKQSTNQFDLYDGMTSEDVLKIMSPKIVQSVKQKKENSFKDIQQKVPLEKNLKTEKNIGYHSKNNKRFSMINSQELDFLFLKNYKEQKKNDTLVKNTYFQKNIIIKPQIKYEVEKITLQIQNSLKNKPKFMAHKKIPSAQFLQTQSPYHPKTQVPKKLPSFSQFTDDFIQKQFLSPTHQKNEQKINWVINNDNFVGKTNNSKYNSKNYLWKLRSHNNHV